MSVTRVVHCKRQRYDVLIDRTTIWGNPFIIGIHGNRQEVIEKFIFAFNNSNRPKFVWMREHIHELKDKILGCWCAPDACHGDYLARRANERKS